MFTSVSNLVTQTRRRPNLHPQQHSLKQEPSPKFPGAGCGILVGSAATPARIRLFKEHGWDGYIGPAASAAIQVPLPQGHEGSVPLQTSHRYMKLNLLKRFQSDRDVYLSPFIKSYCETGKLSRKYDEISFYQIPTAEKSCFAINSGMPDWKFKLLSE